MPENAVSPHPRADWRARLQPQGFVAFSTFLLSNQPTSAPESTAANVA
jgi:hypothetical protein